MILFENYKVMNLDGAIRGMRNPLNSWDKSDSSCCASFEDCDSCPCFSEDENGVKNCTNLEPGYFILGKNDLQLARKLIKAGSDHRKFLRQIFVCVDIAAPLYWWKEFDTYKVATVANSCSTMHTIHKKEFTLDDFSHDHLTECAEIVLRGVIGQLNDDRENYLKTKDKEYWYNMIQLLPSSFNQTRTVTLNYETLRNIYTSRRGHKLDEWHDFRSWIEELPYSADLICDTPTERERYDASQWC